jgi:hypothetical protein
MQVAQALNATVFLHAGDNSVIDNLKQLYPTLNVVQLCDNHDECLQMIQRYHDNDNQNQQNTNHSCALYVGHELVLRYLSVQREGFGVHLEYALPQNSISWAYHSRLNPTIQLYLSHWIYKAKMSGFLGLRYNHYFNPQFCPIGYSGTDCQQPCHPAHGVSDRHGHCICDSTQWAGDDCSIQVLENKNLIPTGAKITAYVFIAINFAAVAASVLWLCIH